MAHLELICELELSTGTERFSQTGLSGASKFYAPRVESFGLASRQVPVIPGEFRVGGMSVEFDNSDNYFSKLRADTPFLNKTFKLLLGDPSLGEGDFAAVFTGKVDSWSISGNLFSITARDDFFSRLDAPVVGSFDKATFPDLPGDPSVIIVPLVYGTVTSEDLSDIGALPAYLIDPNVTSGKFRYVVAQGAIKRVLNAYIYGVLDTPGDRTESQVTYNGTEFTVIDFTTDQRDTSRPNEFEVTVDVEGLTDDGLVTGVLLENPATQLKELMIRNGFVSGDFDAAKVLAAEGVFNSRSIIGGVAVTEIETLRNVVERFTESFNLMIVQTKAGLIGFDVPQPIPPDTTGLVEIDESEIAAGGLEVEGAEDAASDMGFDFARNWQDKEWQKMRTITDATQVTNLGKTIKRSAKLWYVYDDTAANAVVNDRLFFMREERQVVNLPCDSRLFRDVDLGDTLKLTHFAGIASGGAGYAKALFRVVGVGLVMEGLAILCSLRMVDLTAAVLSATSLDDFYPNIEVMWTNRSAGMDTFRPVPTLTPLRT